MKGKTRKSLVLTLVLALVAPLVILVCSITPAADSYRWVAQQSGTTNDLSSVSAFALNRAWAVGAGGTIRYFNGRTWSSQPGQTTHDLNEVFALDNTHVYAVGDHGNVTFFNGQFWSRMNCPTGKNLFGVSATSPYNVWAVGDDGRIVHYDGNAGGDWTIWGSPTEAQISDVTAISDNEAWAVSGRNILRYDSATSTWSVQQQLDENVGLTDIYAADPQNIWVAGGYGLFEYGCVYFYNGSSWTEVYRSSPGAYLFGVSGFNANNVWAAGADLNSSSSLIVHFNGSQWTRETISPSTNTVIWDITAISRGTVWAVGSNGTILYRQTFFNPHIRPVKLIKKPLQPNRPRLRTRFK